MSLFPSDNFQETKKFNGSCDRINTEDQIER